ncbi:MAG: hypothetical protein GWM90_04635, partial [Gemmatimonadetes bacterium]|nr:hypothetical protein [Gemmatimonadota bacterium]NIQ52979.1 hypothetical protein [Gemmatimonadota bacterium]NIU78680.1 hypothetical protein [Gammaproteobacteria bacterium]NIX43428.1 hypothetical protein [Gemmatimonadota bacterium]NIY11884.1 hypothetical protein [Gemmatimonadota bacterium]
MALAVGARRYTGGENHRAFLGLSLALLETTATSIGGQVIEQERHYGPALLAGYQYMADSG